MKRLVNISILLLTLSQYVAAADITGNFAVWGVGKKSCYGMQKDMAESNVDKYKDYMKGFFTAYNIFTEKTYSISSNMNETEIMGWIYAYCSENPMSSYESALYDFTLDHYEDRSKSAKSQGRSGSW